MPNPFSEFGVSDEDIARAIRADANIQVGIDEFVEKEVIPFARSISPVKTGKYAASWKLKKKAKNGFALVGPTAWYSHFIEFGTGADKKFKKSKSGNKIKKKSKTETHTVETAPGVFREFGPNTPTPAFGVAQKVAERFGGTYKGGIDAGVSSDE